MPQIKMPNGDMVQFPDDMPNDQIQSMIRKKFPDSDPGNTRAGDFARGLVHGGSMGLAGNDPGEGASGWRTAGEDVGGGVTSLASGLIPGGPIVKGLVGAGMGGMQPAKDWKERVENAAIGGGSALVGQGVGKAISAARSPLNTLANEAIGATMGHAGLGPWGGYGGLWAGRGIGHSVQQIFGGRGLADLVAAAARNPGLAAYLGIKASPYAEQAGKDVGDYLGKPSQ